MQAPATPILKSSLTSYTYKNGTCTKSIAEAPVMQSVMHFRRYTPFFSSLLYTAFSLFLIFSVLF